MALHQAVEGVAVGEGAAALHSPGVAGSYQAGPGAVEFHRLVGWAPYSEDRVRAPRSKVDLPVEVLAHFLVRAAAGHLPGVVAAV